MNGGVTNFNPEFRKNSKAHNDKHVQGDVTVECQSGESHQAGRHTAWIVVTRGS